MPGNGTVKLKVIVHTDFIMLLIAVNMHAKHFLSLILFIRPVISNYIFLKKRLSYLTENGLLPLKKHPANSVCLPEDSIKKVNAFSGQNADI
jgi:hypothetical protein